jgi:dynactin 1
LLAVTNDDRGDKASLLATSKKALAQAAQLASDAAEARKRNAEATFQMITARCATNLSQRLEILLPSAVVSAELAAVKGEMSLAKVADKASVSLIAVEKVFDMAIVKGSLGVSEFNTLEENVSMTLSDAASQQIAVINHQAMFASITIEIGTDALRLMAAGQWPDLLSEEMSTDLGNLILHSITDLDLALSDQLKLLISEGVLSPMRSSLSDLDQYARNTRLALFGSSDESGKSIIPVDWKPPGWEVMKNLSLGRFACLGATAALCSAVSPMEGTDNEPLPATPRYLADVMAKAKECCASILDVCKNLPGLDLNDSDILTSLDGLSDQYRICSNLLFESIKTTLSKQSITSEDVTKFSSLLEKVLSTVRLLAALVRKAELDQSDMKHHHFLSAEFGDSWLGVTETVSQVRKVNGDPEDVNYLIRARAIENLLTEAVENEPKLAKADAKIGSLEKVSRLHHPALDVHHFSGFCNIHIVQLSHCRNYHHDLRKSKCRTSALLN